jgi:diacylglycerol O-acyltransferase-1
MGDYWRSWNLPVHNFMVRHIYNPLLTRNVPKVIASFLVFFISGIGHEYIVNFLNRLLLNFESAHFGLSWAY